MIRLGLLPALLVCAATLVRAEPATPARAIAALESATRALVLPAPPATELSRIAWLKAQSEDSPREALALADEALELGQRLPPSAKAEVNRWVAATRALLGAPQALERFQESLTQCMALDPWARNYALFTWLKAVHVTDVSDDSLPRAFFAQVSLLQRREQASLLGWTAPLLKRLGWLLPARCWAQHLLVAEHWDLTWPPRRSVPTPLEEALVGAAQLHEGGLPRELAELTFASLTRIRRLQVTTITALRAALRADPAPQRRVGRELVRLGAAKSKPRTEILLRLAAAGVGGLDRLQAARWLEEARDAAWSLPSRDQRTVLWRVYGLIPRVLPPAGALKSFAAERRRIGQSKLRGEERAILLARISESLGDLPRAKAAELALALHGDVLNLCQGAKKGEAIGQLGLHASATLLPVVQLGSPLAKSCWGETRELLVGLAKDDSAKVTTRAEALRALLALAEPGAALGQRGHRSRELAISLLPKLRDWDAASVRVALVKHSGDLTRPQRLELITRVAHTLRPDSQLGWLLEEVERVLCDPPHPLRRLAWTRVR